jgi:hypothetical protein
MNILTLNLYMHMNIRLTRLYKIVHIYFLLILFVMI